MATSVHSGEDSAAHTASDQWQSFELRMRRRRVERLLTRATEACREGREDAAREALVEIEQLSPFEPRLTELRAQVDAFRAASSSAAASSVLVTHGKSDAEFTSSVETPSIPAERSFPPTRRVIEPSPLPVETRPITVDATPNIAEPLIDLPLVIDERSESTEAARADAQEKRSGRGVAIAAAALLACGAVGWLIGPKMSTLMQTDRAVSAEPNQPALLPSPGAAARTDEPKPADALPPVQVAVDEVPAASATVEPTPTEPQTVPLPSPQPASVELRSTEPLVREPVAAPSRTDAPPPPEPPPLAPISALPNAAASVERPAVPTLAESTIPVTRPASSLPESSSTNEPTAPATAPPRAAPDAAHAVAGDEERIREILVRYASAYSRLDAAAATAIFPGLDRRALARAFDGLASQNVSLGACDVRVAIESAIVDCAGSATWTPKIGGGSRKEPRRWQFRLRNTAGEWQMVAAKVR